MFIRFLASLFLLTGFLCGEPAAIPRAALEEAARHARTDSVGSGMCGRGVWSALTAIGYDQGIRSADGQDWETVLSRAGWVPLYCPTPSLAPLGSVLVYFSDVRVFGKNLVGTKGGVFGHAELVGEEQGSRVYISDAPRKTPGGTVPRNFTCRAWVPPEFLVPGGRLASTPLRRSWFNPGLVAADLDALKSDRLEMAKAYFSGSPQPVQVAGH